MKATQCCIEKLSNTSLGTLPGNHLARTNSAEHTTDKLENTPAAKHMIHGSFLAWKKKCSTGKIFPTDLEKKAVCSRE